MSEWVRASTIELTNNVSTATVSSNIHAASLRDLPWLYVVPATDQECLIVGGGPSLASDVEAIRDRQQDGAYVLALNGAGCFLNDSGLTPDALMILDARPEVNVGFLACEAGQVFLASQCDPTLFDASADRPVTLFHIDTPNIGAYVPGTRPIQAIGGGASVGLIALSLAYTRGFRALHLYGYDSSYTSTDHHAYRQDSNDGEDVIDVQVYGHPFRAAAWMVYQVEQYKVLVPQLLRLGCTMTVHGTGLLPSVAWHMTLPLPAMTEHEKYDAMWQRPSYRVYSPGEEAVMEFIHLTDYERGITTFLDFGCGTGRAAQAIHDRTDCPVTAIDFVDHALDAGITVPFVCHDLTLPLALQATVGYCTDVLEHLPPHQVPLVIAHLMQCVTQCYFRIALYHDGQGALIGQPLHLSVCPASWWRAQFAAYTILTDGEIPSVNQPTYMIYVRNP